MLRAARGWQSIIIIIIIYCLPTRTTGTARRLRRLMPIRKIRRNASLASQRAVCIEKTAWRDSFMNGAASPGWQPQLILCMMFNIYTRALSTNQHTEGTRLLVCAALSLVFFSVLLINRGHKSVGKGSNFTESPPKVDFWKGYSRIGYCDLNIEVQRAESWLIFFNKLYR